LLNEKISEVLKDPEYGQQLQKLDMAPTGSRPDAFKQLIASEVEILKRVAAAAGIVPQ